MSVIWLLMAVYLCAMIGIGIYAGRKEIKGAEDYLLAGRRLGPVMFAGTLAATEIGGGSSVGVAAKAYGSWGLSAGWYVTAAGVAILMVSFVAPMLRKAMATTVPEIIGRRFGTESYVIASILSVVSLVTLGGVQITATATILSVLLKMNFNTAILLSGAVVTFYTMIGGMWSVTLTDFVQFFFILIGFALAIPFALHNVGGWNWVVAHIPPEQLGFSKIGWPTILGLIVMYFTTFSTGQEAVQRYYAAKNAKTAVAGSLLCGGLMALYSFVPAILGLIALAAFPEIDANTALATVAVQLTPPWIAGIVLAAVVSATLSSASGDFLGAATVFAKDIWQQYVNKNMGDKKIMTFTRAMVLVFGMTGIIISLASKAIIPMLVFAFTMRSAGPFAAFIFGLIWKKATKSAGLISIVAGSIAGGYWQYLNEPYGIMAIIAGSLASVLAFALTTWIELALGRKPAPTAMLD
ncbi:sodium/solute symporter [Lucifera butyrica]|uniref:Sodium/solute symporter n=1 Tax=Lucifera butyrica TaxID=1351585 RepID=A0A498RE22_9FIRM|nr:sodium/solute symporter [Lucifera butyrica]VBB09070.1 sodium/solute symporter [Lucifera butyrica]